METRELLHFKMYVMTIWKMCFLWASTETGVCDFETPTADMFLCLPDFSFSSSKQDHSLPLGIMLTHSTDKSSCFFSSSYFEAFFFPGISSVFTMSKKSCLLAGSVTMFCWNNSMSYSVSFLKVLGFFVPLTTFCSFCLDCAMSFEVLCCWDVLLIFPSMDKLVKMSLSVHPLCRILHFDFCF